LNNENKFLEEMSDDGNVRNKKLVIVLGVAVIIGAIVITLALGGVIYKNISNEASLTQTLAYELTSRQQAVTVAEDEESFDFDLNGNSSQVNTVADNNVQSAVPGVPNVGQEDNATTTVKATKNQAVEYYEQLSPNGDNVLSDHFENRYIKQISRDYGVDSDLLVAIYSEPDTGNNFVLEFNGKKDSSGSVIKSPDTLAKVYLVDKNGGVKIATGKESGNVGVSYAEGLLSISMIKTVVMEQYPDYFTGLKK
jgi:hypothetical protein